MAPAKDTVHNCLDCNKQFGRKFELVRHKVLHEKNVEDLKIPCTWPECMFKSLQRSNLNTHINAVHLKRKDHKCTVCPVAFGDNAARIRHERNIHGIHAKNRNEVLSETKAPTTTFTEVCKEEVTATSTRVVEETLLVQTPSPASASAPSPSTSPSPNAGSLLPTPTPHSTELPFTLPAPPFATTPPSGGTPVTDAFNAADANGPEHSQSVGFNHNPFPYMYYVVCAPETQGDMHIEAYFPVHDVSHGRVQVPLRWSNATVDMTNGQMIVNAPVFDASSSSTFSDARASVQYIKSEESSPGLSRRY